MSLNSTISRQKYNRACGCQGVEEPISLIMRSWDFTKRANVAGCETKLWKSSGAARIILWQCNSNLPAIENCLIQTETYRRWTELSCCRGCRLLPEKKLEAEWYTGHGAAVLIKQHRSTTTQGQWLVFGKAFENHSNSYHFPRASPSMDKEDNSTTSSDDSSWDRWAVLQTIKALPSQNQSEYLCLGSGLWHKLGCCQEEGY